WMGSELSMDDNNYRLSLLDFSLYSGVCGILIFLAEIYKKNKQDYYLKVCKNSLNYIINNSDKLDVSSSMYNGIGSISYTCFYLYQITDDKYYEIYGKKYFEDMVDKIQNSEFESLAIDLLDGLSGNIIFCLELYKIYKDKKYLNIARNFTVLLKEKLKSKMKSNNSELLTGLGHGISGISLAIHKVSKYYPEFTNDVESFIEYEDKNFIERFLNWKDLRSNISTENKNINYWCHGRPGILFARSIIYKNKSLPLSKEINYENIVNLAYKQTKSMKRICLCHGIFGNLEMFKIISKCFSNSYSINDISQFKEELLSNNTTIPGKIKSLLNNNLVGLMTGISGVGLSLLQDKKNIINPLLLKLPCPGEL
ncbi:lanthionine synthetase LanC family protein, partial [Staphylococcus warneri]